MKPAAAFLGILVVIALPLRLEAEDRSLTGEEVRQVLSGNSIVSLEFGCVHFLPDGVANLYSNGQFFPGTWRVDGDLYFSSGQCGETGCKLAGEHPNYVFRRIDGGYEQGVLVIPGNHCEKEGLISDHGRKPASGGESGPGERSIGSGPA